ncbi:MAG TPA: hypothetical protein VJ553_01330 [Candidatus Paceibacterota bacterium]|nr:hypothetical protein [Candidatus Paceibacterota bacterium]
MLLALLLGCACASHPLEQIRLVPDQMHQLQLPYRYHIRVAYLVWHPTVNRHEIEIEDVYAQQLDAIRIEAPQGDRRFPIGTVSVLVLKLSDVLTFPNDRYDCNDSWIVEYPDSVLVTITDRTEKESIFPPPPPPDY